MAEWDAAAVAVAWTTSLETMEEDRVVELAGWAGSYVGNLLELIFR